MSGDGKRQENRQVEKPVSGDRNHVISETYSKRTNFIC